MNQTRTRWIVAGLAAGAAAGAAAAALAAARARRLEMAAEVDEITRQAISRLGIPAESCFLTAGSPDAPVRLHTILAGPENGPLVVLLHGFPECWHGWHHQIRALAQAGYRVAAPDQRGYNLSDKPEGIAQYGVDLLAGDVMELIKGLGREQAVVAGHDWGGVVAWRLAMDYPEAVDKLVIMNAPHPRAMARELKTNREQQLRSSYMLFFQMLWLPDALLTLSPERTARLALQGLAARPWTIGDDEIEVLAAALAQPGAMTAMLNWYRAARRYPPARHTQPIAAPTLVAWGENDPALGTSLTSGLDEWVPRLRLHLFPNTGHWVQREAAGAVNSLMLTFLNEGVAAEQPRASAADVSRGYEREGE